MAHRSSPRLLVLHTVRLHGVADADTVADHTGLDRGTVDAQLAELSDVGLTYERRGRIAGHALTPEGRVHVDRMLAAELDEAGVRREVEASYHEFLEFNDELLAVCTAWQLRDVDGETVVNDHTDPDHDHGVHRQLVALHERVVPVVDAVASCLSRFAAHRRRLQIALDHVLAGDDDWFTTPMFPSYHTVWFQLHEDLLATLGRERGAESGAGEAAIEGSH